MKKMGLITAAVLLGTALTATAGDLDRIEEAQPLSETYFYENRVDLSIESASLWGAFSQTAYHHLPQVLSVRWMLDDLGNPGWRRGNTEFVFSAFHSPILTGRETRFSGLLFGPRYNFVQEGWDWAPFVESRVGFGVTDSTGEAFGQGQDFILTFTITAGARYLISQHAALTVGAMYQHISSGGLSEPEFENVGLDSVGPHVSFSYGF
jgi:hypothetical protein